MNDAGPPEVSIVMPVFDAEPTLARALGCVLAQRTARSFEVIVVDDGSRDGSVALARSFAARDPRVHVHSKSNGGEASALNVGFREAQGARAIAIVEADVEPEPDWLETCLLVLETEKDAIAVGGLLLAPRDDPWIARLAGYEIEAKFRSKPREAKHLTSAAVLYWREAWGEAGPFDERLVNASLDSVFNARLLAKGRRLVYEPRARAAHHWKTTFGGYLRRMYAYSRFRVHNPVRDLYPADRFLAVRVLLSALALVACVVSGIAALGFVPTGAGCLLLGGGPALLAVSLLLEVPGALGVVFVKRDPAAFLYPPVHFLRNVVSAFGYAVGLLMKAVGRA